ncbi:MAG: AraC family transcriptional regulator [Oscillospiraceae bacterium]|jgi:AraC-like DNA-binding protein|nr:AraC family transcriptional regulator [Oscillospiraceae bacterium]
MSWIEDIQRAISYIETNLLESVNADDISHHIHSSSDYFQKLFPIVTGFTVSEYIRNRRLTLAGVELAEARSKVIDAAFKYGYETPESFAKAFTRFHGFAPSKARSSRTRLKMFKPITINITISGGFSMSKDVMAWATDEEQKFRIHNNTNEDGIEIYAVNPPSEQIEQLIDNLGNPFPLGWDYDFLILEAKSPIAGDSGSGVLQTAVEKDTPGEYTVESIFFHPIDTERIKRVHHQIKTKDIGDVKRMFVGFTMGIVPDNAEWTDMSEEFSTVETDERVILIKKLQAGELTRDEYLRQRKELAGDMSPKSWDVLELQSRLLTGEVTGDEYNAEFAQIMERYR